MRLRAIGQREEGRPQAGLRPARQGGKNDANDAAAICEAASRPQMHFVPIKTVEQQSMLCVHRLREVLSDVLEDASNELAGLARLTVQRAKEQWAELDAHIQWCSRMARSLELGWG